LKQLAYRVEAFLCGKNAFGYLKLNFWVFLEVSVELGIE
jgi:hypothetical protein